MTLRQAYKSWAMAPRNMVLAKNSRDAVEREKKKKDKKMKEKTDDLTQAKPYGITTDMNTVVMKDIKIFSNDELIAEMRRRGWKGNITMTLNIEL